MEQLSEMVKLFDLDSTNEEYVQYEYINVFKNPNNLPINQIHLEKTTLELRKDVNLDDVIKSSQPFDKCYETKKHTIPALDKSWLPGLQPFHSFQPYNFLISKEENTNLFKKNWLFLESLNYLIGCDYHQFWCSVLFDTKIGAGLHSFLLNPILPHQLDDLDDNMAALYLSVLSQFLAVYERLITFTESPVEYMSQKVGVKFLLDKKLLNLPIVITLILLYQDLDAKFVNNLVKLYFADYSLFRDKEIEEMLNHVMMSFEMIGGHICGFEKDAVIIPIAIDQRPAVFDIKWFYSLVNYLLNTINTLFIILKYNKAAIEDALTKEIPFRLSFTYENVFYHLYESLNGRREVEDDSEMSERIFHEIALARNCFVDVYNCFVSHCLDKALGYGGDTSNQQNYIETYLKLLQHALEDEFFICDYHEKYDVTVLNDVFASCTDIDSTRTDYIVNCITALRRHNRIWKTLKVETKTFNKAKEKYAPYKFEKNPPEKKSIQKEKKEQSLSLPAENLQLNNNPNEDEIEDLIKFVVDMFPHLGDGFVLSCLEAYNYQASDVISAILEENLPPHIIDIPFDLIRIPPEPEPVKLKQFKEVKPRYDDALKLLNDKKDLKEIKTFILDGIQYTNEYDMYEDEYDDRLDEETVKVIDYGSEDILKYNPNYDDAVSDTSYSENEFDDHGAHVKESESRGTTAAGNKANFCEDPAVVREKREARRRAQGKSRDVVGKAKGQGQEKSVLNNRQKKNVNKSSRGNHSRKSGAQWKRNKAMVPS